VPVLQPSVCSAGLPRAFVAASERAAMVSTAQGPAWIAVRGGSGAVPRRACRLSDGRAGTRVCVSVSGTLETSLDVPGSTLRPSLLCAGFRFCLLKFHDVCI